MENESSGGRIVGKLLRSPRKLLITILFGNLLVNTTSTSVVTSISIKMFGGKGVGYAFLLMSILLLTVGEIFPKVIAFKRSEIVSRAVIVPLKIFHNLINPLLYPLTKFTDIVMAGVRDRLGQARREFSSQELLVAIDIGLKEENLDEYEHGVLTKILEFREKLVREIMTPSVEVFSVSMKSTPGELLDQVRRSGFSRVPLYGESTDEIKGIIHVKDLIGIDQIQGEESVASLVRQPVFVPESARVSEFFKDLISTKTHMAVVIDEYGSFVGIVTMEDMLEELIGEIRDAREHRTAEYQFIDDWKIVVLGNMEIDKFNQVFGTRLSDERFETIAGYVIGAIGRIPNEGEVVAVGGLRFHIISAQPNRVRKMRVEKL
jgi:putative hemolysin